MDSEILNEKVMITKLVHGAATTELHPLETYNMVCQRKFVQS